VVQAHFRLNLQRQFEIKVSAVGTLILTRNPCQDKNVNIDADIIGRQKHLARGKSQQQLCGHDDGFGA
jgi:hypothetical protein